MVKTYANLDVAGFTRKELIGSGYDFVLNLMMGRWIDYRYNQIPLEDLEEFPDIAPLLEQAGIYFELNPDELNDTWTIIDKTPHFKKLTQIKNAITLENVAEIFSGNIPRKELLAYDKNKNAVDYLRISDLKDNKINSVIKERGVLSKSRHSQDRKFLKDGDIVISCQGTIGKVAIVETKGRKIIPAPQIIVLRPDKKKIQPDYLLRCLKNKRTQEQIEKLVTGAYIPRFSVESIKKVMISVPSLPKQREKSKELEKLQKSINEMEDMIKKKRAMMEEVEFG